MSDASQIRQVIDDFAVAIGQGDATAIARLYANAPSTLYLGSEGDEIAFGPDEQDVLFRHGFGRGEAYDIVWHRYAANTREGIAWVAVVGALTTEGTSRATQTTLRLTAVLAQVEQKWLLHQVHLSEPHGDFWQGFRGERPEWAR
jgi:ketosteroid isomerase-like protein